MCIGLSEIMKSTSRDAVSPSQGTTCSGEGGLGLTLEVQSPVVCYPLCADTVCLLLC